MMIYLSLVNTVYTAVLTLKHRVHRLHLKYLFTVLMPHYAYVLVSYSAPFKYPYPPKWNAVEKLSLSSKLRPALLTLHPNLS